MSKFLVTILLLAVAVNTEAFTAHRSQSLATRTHRSSTPTIITGPSFEIPSTVTSTALNLKVDPNSIKGNKNEKGNAKMAAYGGSVAIAVLLPVAFLIWSAVSK